MSKRKEGWEKGLGPFSRDTDMPLRPAKGDDPNAKGKDISREVYENNDSPAIRGTRPGFS